MKFEPRKILLFTAILIGGLGIAQFFLNPIHSIPPEFLQAKGQGALVAQRIVVFLNSSLDRLQQIGKFDHDENIGGALRLISQQIAESKNHDVDAVELSKNLEIMARAAADIRPAQTRDIAVEAVSDQVALVSRLIVYNESLKQLFNLLNDKFHYGVGTDGKVQELVTSLNDSAKAINDLNDSFNQLMQQVE